jgi:hypothetical protein
VDTPERKWSFTPLEGTSEAVTDELETFIKVLRLDEIAPGRFSSLLVLRLFGGFKAGTLDPHRAVLEIQALEMSQPSIYKDPVQNKRPPLAGLWHKHYGQLGLGPLAKNIQNALAKYKIPYWLIRLGRRRPPVRNVFLLWTMLRLSQTMPFMGTTLADRKPVDLQESGSSSLGMNKRTTISPLPLTTAQHIRQQIDALCVREFPFLKDVLTS